MFTNEKQFVESLEPDLRELDARLREALKVDVPADLADRCVMAALLKQSLSVAPPPGLADRIEQASAARLRPTVIGRIGWEIRIALAAGLLLAAAVGLGLLGRLDQDRSPASIDRQIDQLAEHVRTTVQPGELDHQLRTAADEVEELAFALQHDLLADTPHDPADDLMEEINRLEAEFDVETF